MCIRDRTIPGRYMPQQRPFTGINRAELSPAALQMCIRDRQRRTWHNPVREAQEMEYSDSRCIVDMLSILAQARSYDPKDYKVGQKRLCPMATGRRVEEQTLIYRGKEEVKANNDTVYRCLVDVYKRQALSNR